ncbi:hypothetical protein FRC02_003988 [Tulasnella sp. 418]|nr:hypothetical protein FRC02_003988 [Tulasnella sp. 418]
MRTTTPTEKEFYDSLAPDHKRKVDEYRSKLKEDERKAKLLSGDPDNSKPLWTDPKKSA